jgi:hypothetical protein
MNYLEMPNKCSSTKQHNIMCDDMDIKKACTAIAAFELLIMNYEIPIE